MSDLPDDVIEEYKLRQKAVDGYVYVNAGVECMDCRMRALLPNSSSKND